ncbi:organic solute transporter Ostalpha-domain-containing protein [Glomus cerebriforme]|uniref:Organic solute transporter Ostalpha-domain-containing protein n=1 Tax=Glomus cerebriforme TaxID=658196 RepID=A0A397TQ71_9GLOM|nr:organic solute transporter Ostalpha-domain-containing protein [Glomus cerebriforme]
MLELSIAETLLLEGDIKDVGGGGSSEKFQNPYSVRAIAALFALLATTLSIFSVLSHLKNYRKPSLQRYVVRIIIMVPIYAISSYISLASTSAAFYVDGIRDMYEAFVIYCFFNLLVNYLGGERSLLILLHGRPPTPHLFPVNIFIKEIDIGDPYAFLFLKRGILQYVYTKPIITVLTMILKWADTYGEGHIEIKNGYIWISLIYNVSCSLCFYCLIIFYVCTKDDLKPYRPVPKFLCVKAVIFFSFWQGFALSILVSLGIIHDTAEGSAESFSVSIQDFLITIEMLFAALAHYYAFSYKDYIEPNIQSGRMPIKYAFKDCMGFKDLIEDTLETIRGSRFNYRTFEPAEGMAHIGPSRTARIMAGLRFTGGGSGKYWLPNQRTALLSEQDDDKRSLNFPDPDTDDEIEAMYEHSRKLGEYGDYNFPVIYSYTNEQSSRPKPKRKRTMSKRNRKGKGKAQNIFGTDSEEDIENGLNVKPVRKERQLSDLPPFREGCIDLIKEVPDGYGKRYERYADRLGTSLPASSNKSTTMQPYSSISMRDPFVQIPTTFNNTLQPLQINGSNETVKEETVSDEYDENDDPLRSNRASYLSTSMKSLEKNIWNDDIWKL